MSKTIFPLLAAGVASFVLALSPIACSSSSTSTKDAGPVTSDAGKKVDSGSHDAGQPTFCEGGFVRKVDGGTATCEGLCKPSLCTQANNVCVGNDCVLQCTTDLDCAQGQGCLPATEDGTGTAITTCQANGKPAIGTLCPNGNECTNLKACGDGTPCPDSGTCAVGSCEALSCLSSGVGDETAYCTRLDCRADLDCPGGYWCEQLRDPHAICGQPPPDSNICGSTNDNCVDAGSDAATGTTYTAGALCTERNACVLRKQCDPCTTNLDCSRVPGQTCVQGSCAPTCKTDGDCVDGLKCSSGSCLPRGGGCTVTSGKGAVCDSCRLDSDCGPNLICGAFETGAARVCILVPVIAMSCMADSDCPTTASGLHVVCLGEAEGLGATDLGYDTCGYAPFNAAANEYACWPGNPGAACLTNADCADGNCTGVIPAIYGDSGVSIDAGGDGGPALEQAAQAGNCQ